MRGTARSFVTERGSSLGYNNLVVDMRSLAIMRKFAPVVFDATHSVQLPSASHGDEDQPAVSGGQPEFIPVLSRAAVAAGVDGVFMEVHDNPKEAKSDGANALDTRHLRALLKELQAIKKALDAAPRHIRAGRQPGLPRTLRWHASCIALLIVRQASEMHGATSEQFCGVFESGSACIRALRFRRIPVPKGRPSLAQRFSAG